MSVADLGYERWDGELGRSSLPWWPIVREGVALQRENKLLRRFIFLAWTPFLFYAALFLAICWATDQGAIARLPEVLQEVLENVLGPTLFTELVRNPEGARSFVWSLLVYNFLRYTQIFCVIVIVALAGPHLISEDIETNALALYFSRPITPVHYILGKLGVLLVFVCLVTLLPAVALWGLGVLFSPGLAVVAHTLPVLGRTILACLVIVVPLSLGMLALSSLTSNGRVLGFCWVGAWVVGMAFHSILAANGIPWGRRISIQALLSDATWWVLGVEGLAAPYLAEASTFRDLFASIRPSTSSGMALPVLGGLAVVSVVVLLARVRRHGIGAA